MANYNPPLENLPIFDNAMFIHADIPITQAAADLRYLRYPNAQGTENLLTINVAGLASMLSGMDVVDGVNKTNIDQSGANISIDNNVNNGTLIYKANNGVGVETSILSLNSTTGSLTTTGTTTLASTDLTLTTTNPPTSSAVQPAANDSSTKVPTTAWVQSAIALAPSPSTLLSSNNTWTGTNAFNNVAPITSTATQPANNDSSTIIPTTAWVQSAITTGAPNLLPLNNAWTGTNNFSNTVSFSSGADSLSINQIGVDTNITNNQTSGTIILQTKDGGGNTIDTLSINSDSNGIVSLASINMSGLNVEQVGKVIYGDLTEQTSAFTGAWSLAGSYTSTNMTINNQGQITALSNGGSSTVYVQPYYGAQWYGNTGPQYSGPTTINLAWSNYASWGPDVFSTFRVSCTVVYTTTTTLDTVYTLDCLLDIFPYRLVGSSTLASLRYNLATNSINGNSSYLMTDATYAPNGRQFWSHGIISTGALTNGWIQLYMTTAGTWGLQFDNPNASTATNFRVNISVEQIVKGTNPIPTCTNINSAGWYGNTVYGFN